MTVMQFERKMEWKTGPTSYTVETYYFDKNDRLVRVVCDGRNDEGKTWHHDLGRWGLNETSKNMTPEKLLKWQPSAKVIAEQEELF